MELYKNIVTAKDGKPIPIFFNEKPMFSKYNPTRDVEIFTNQFVDIQNKTVVFIAGIGTALHFQKLLENENISLIFALENDFDSLSFCEKFIPESSKIVSCTLENFESKILNNYIPQLHGDFQYNSLKSWILSVEELNSDFNEKLLQNKILNILKNISRDIATQSYFGKIWHKNILQNIINFQIGLKNNLLIEPSFFDTNKTLAIIGASPNLDKTISEIKDNSNKYFIIATDTSFPVLLQHNIIPNAVATLDGQCISSRHFLQTLPQNTILICDFCSNSNIVSKFIKNKSKILFTNTGHPLVSYFDLWLQNQSHKKSIYTVSAGNGTVLQMALDFGLSIGFTKYCLFGAEFAYTMYKPYTKGTYFDFQFNSSSTKVNSTENLYSNLMFRTNLIEENDTKTTENLKSYKEYLDKYLSTKKFSHNLDIKLPTDFDFNDFFTYYINNLEKNDKNTKKTVLPLLAWINKCKKNSDIYNEALYFTKKMLHSFFTEE